MSINMNTSSKTLSKNKKKKTPKIKTITYKVPRSIYEKAKEQIYGCIELNNEASKCHQTEYSRFNTNEAANCRQYLLEAAKQAMVS